MSVRVVTSDLSGLLDRFEGTALPRAAANALNRAGKVARTAAIEGLARDFGVSTAFVGARSRVALTEATPTNLRIGLSVSGARVPLIEFSATQNAAGVTYRLGSVTRAREHAFVARMRSGHLGVYRRRSFGPGSRPERRGPNRSWLPIDEAFGPSLSAAFRRPEVSEPVTQVAMTELAAGLREELAKTQGKG